MVGRVLAADDVVADGCSKTFFDDPVSFSANLYGKDFHWPGVEDLQSIKKANYLVLPAPIGIHGWYSKPS